MSKILAIDDNPIITDFVKDILGNEHEVITCDNGKSGLEAALKILPDLIVIDVMMPVMDGITAVAKLKAEPTTKGIPIIMLTALGKDEDIVRGLDAGADDYMEKPFSTKVFSARVNTHLRSKALYDELEDAYSRLKELDTLKNNFIAMASHELRTPLNIVTGYVEILLDNSIEELNPRSRQILEVMLSTSEGMTKTIKDMLSLSIIEAGQLPLEAEKLDLSNLLAQSVESLNIMARKKDVSIEFTPNEKPLIGIFDQIKINQVISNLIGNAIKFSPKESTITVTAKKIDEDLTVSIADSGNGISEQELDRIFDEFYKGENSESGTGLGLAICKKLIALHDGRLWAESKKGSGTTFYFSFPITGKV
ncbi:MAG: hybrid sensor histidine kinase/response regulator [Deltaproteobacteria bacterium]|nr:hybrid sensor histidine kinase/response regulator [Deltaproteobacteria bacterium]